MIEVKLQILAPDLSKNGIKVYKHIGYLKYETPLPLEISQFYWTIVREA